MCRNGRQGRIKIDIRDADNADNRDFRDKELTDEFIINVVFGKRFMSVQW